MRSRGQMGGPVIFNSNQLVQRNLIIGQILRKIALQGGTLGNKKMRLFGQKVSNLPESFPRPSQSTDTEDSIQSDVLSKRKVNDESFIKYTKY